MKKFIKKNIFYILSFLIPIFVMLLAFSVKGVWFNGEGLSFGDMQAQYSNLLVYFRKIVTGSESLFYSINKGLGGDMYGTFMYYMLSPFNLIILFFKESNIMQAIYFIILGKIGMCGLTMFIYLKHKNISNIRALMFSICYALMAFIVDSYFCVMWLDSVYMTPLILLGIDKLIDDKKIDFYIITLALGIIFNFYMGYMICIFSVLYYAYRLCLKYKLNEKEEIKSSIFRFIISLLLSGLVTSFVWLPSVIETLKTNREGVGTTTTLINTIKSLFIGSYNEESILNYYQPNLYCGIIILILLISFLVSKKNNNLKKGLVLTSIFLLIISIFVPFVSYVWHGFSYPIGYNFRFTYLFCLFYILISSEELENIDYLKKRQKLALTILGLCILIFFKYFDKAWITLVFLILYMIILSLKIDKNIKDYILFVIVLIELSINCVMSFYPANNATKYSNFNKDICSSLPNDTFYRVSGLDYYGTDELIGCNKSSTKGFYSTINNNIVKFYNKVGFTGGANVYSDNQDNTPIIYSILGTKYFYSKYRINNYKLIKELKINKFDYNSKVNYEDKLYIYENEEALSLGYMIEDIKNLSNLNIYEYQNELLKTLSGTNSDILKKVKNNSENKGLSNSKYIYLYLNDYKSEGSNVDFSVNGVDYSIGTGPIFKVENNFNSDYISLSSNIEAYYLDNDAYIDSINKLKENEIKDIKINKNIITGSINSKKDSILMLSIPYEDGITVYVDNKKVKIDKIYDMFIGVHLKQGKHDIRIEYKNTSCKYGIIISLIALIIIIYYKKENDKEVLDEKSRKKSRRR